MFFKKTPLLIQKIFPHIFWRFENTAKVFLTFDDGPHPESTPLLLSLLEKYDIKATFFLLGEKMDLYPNLVELIKEKGHTVGFHGQKHLSGWTTSNDKYLQNTLVKKKLEINLFRPPYGRMNWSQYQSIIKHNKIIMWDLMPGDFDPNIESEACLNNILKHLKAGSIVALHDTPEAYKKLKFILPKVSNWGKERVLEFDAIRELQVT